ncbi:MAG: isochorismatase family protein [bacterium]|nr:isochorismatase family protein [bacterium]
MVKRIDKDRVLLLVIDMQEKLMPVVKNGAETIGRAEKAIAVFQALELPVIVTEQYPKGLGETVACLQPYLDRCVRVEKLSFSCCGEENFTRELEDLGRTDVLIAGVESHVCVLQTALDLIDKGFTPYIMTDAVSSQREADMEVALERAFVSGAVLTTVESALFEIIKTAGSKEFKVYRTALDGLVP